ncbi:DUF397 domain-containing protein [Gandjariella thermophila]|uniref:DUF397 domain-containing protein n=1 Tax=Gandjariella thermophila TaxID=1931992 RepID=A0A4D4JFA4_9PSEU|nr:DUF397 domain-containing protein [Gandjariella thermophila]GDY32553.1 hypothetical protein GTS_41860 [Gandjariella thermophila]
MKNWRKSSHSAQANGCVEVANTLDAIRDSKNPTGPTLHVNVTELVTAVKAGRLQR